MSRAGSHENPDGWAEEHAPPRWLQRQLGILDHVVHQAHVGPDDEAPDRPGLPPPIREKSKRLPRGERLVLGDVCYRCNNGWLNDLETAVRPILIPLVDGTRNVTSLSDAERETLARWTLKTAFVIDATERKRFIPAEHAQRIMRGEGLAPGIAVFAHSHGQTATFARQITRNGFVPSDHAVPNVAELHAASYRCALLFGELLLLVTFWPPVEGWRFAIWPGVHHQIWPLEPLPLSEKWSIPLASAPRTLLAFCLSLSVVYGDVLDPLPASGLIPWAQYQHEEELIRTVNDHLDAHYVWGERVAEKGANCPCGSGLRFEHCHGKRETE